MVFHHTSQLKSGQCITLIFCDVLFFLFLVFFLYTGKGHCVPRVVSTFQDSRVALLLYEVIINS